VHSPLRRSVRSWKEILTRSIFAFLPTARSNTEHGSRMHPSWWIAHDWWIAHGSTSVFGRKTSYDPEQSFAFGRTVKPARLNRFVSHGTAVVMLTPAGRYAANLSTAGKLLPIFGMTRLEEITQQKIKAYLYTRTDLIETTINRYRGTLSMIFQEIIWSAMSKTNPAR
jgi:hypothetical protein